MNNNLNVLQTMGCEVLEKKGEGAFGAVYKCEKQGKIVAVKIIDKSKIQDFMKKYIKQEIEAMKAISDPHCIKLEAAHEDGNCIYIIMEYCTQNLLTYLKEHQSSGITEKDAITIFYDIMLGMQAIHRHKYLHRDLKPENILYENGIFKICDFGFARKLEDGTMAKTYCGTDEFMAPEIHQKQEYNEKADIWSLGVLLFVIIFLHYPFLGNQGGSMINVIEKYCKFQPFSLEEVNSLPSRKRSLEKSRILSKDLKDLFSRIFVYDYKERISYRELYQHPVFNQLDEQYQESRKGSIAYFEENEKQVNQKIQEKQMQYMQEYEKNPIVNAPMKQEYNEYEQQKLFTDIQASKKSVMKQNVDAKFISISQVYQYEVNRYEFIMITLDKCKTCEKLAGYQNVMSYYLCKLAIFSINQLILSLEQRKNIFSQPNFNEFIGSSNFYQILAKLKSDLDKMEQEIFRYKFSAQEDCNNLDKKIQTQVINSITDRVLETNFDQFKVPFRLTMITIEKLFDTALQQVKTQQEKAYYQQLKLYVACCHVFNRIFDRETIFTNLSVFVKSHGSQISLYEFFTDFYKWIETTNPANIDAQINQIWKTFF